jgi:hypothetical protein
MARADGVTEYSLGSDSCGSSSGTVMAYSDSGDRDPQVTCSPDVQELRNDTGPGLSPGPLLVDSKVGLVSKCSTNARKKLFTRAGGAEPRSHLSGGAAFLIAELRLYSGMRAHSGRIRQLGLQMRPSIEACGGNHESIFNSGNRRRLINTTGNKHYG